MENLYEKGRLNDFEKKIGYRFSDKKLLVNALCIQATSTNTLVSA